MAQTPDPKQPANTSRPDDDWQLPDATAEEKGKWEGEPSGTPKPRGGLAGLLGPAWDDPRGRPLLLLSLALMLGVCLAACFLVSLVIVSERGANGIFSNFGGGGGPAQIGTSVPITSALPVVQVAGTPLPAGVPNRITVGGSAFKIEPMTIANGEWAYDGKLKETAFWATGTLVNYVIGLPNTTDNVTLFESLKPDDLIVLETGVGTLRYRVGEIATVKSTDASLLRNQNTSQLSLLLLGESGEQRRVILAPYVDEAQSNVLASDRTPVNLGEVRVIATGERVIPGTSVGLAADKNYYQVNLRVTNVVSRALDAAQFYSELVDGAGNRYPLSPQGSTAAGAAGWASGLLKAGDVLTLTAGFEVPYGMQGPSLQWLFSTAKTSPDIAKVAIPYKTLATVPTPVATAISQAKVQLISAQIAPDGTEVRFVGNITNLSSQPLDVNLTDLQLATEAGALSPINKTLPPIPWVVAPGEAPLTFQVNFARPAPGPAYFTVLGKVWRINIPAN